MKRLNTGPITNSAQFPVKKGTLDFLQQAHKETVAAVIQALIGVNYDPTVVYILYGCVNTGSLPVFTISEGAAYYNGEVYYVDAVSFTPTGTNIPVFTISQSQYTIDADPVTFTDTTVKNVHDIFKLTIAQGANGSGIMNYPQAYRLNFVIPAQVQLNAPKSTPYLDNILQIIGAYPNYVLYVPRPSDNAFPILIAGTLQVGDVDGSIVAGHTGTDIQVTFPTPVSSGNYHVAGSIVSNGNPDVDTTVKWSVRDKQTTGFKVHFRETDALTQNIAFDYICVKKA